MTRYDRSWPALKGVTTVLGTLEKKSNTCKCAIGAV